MPDSTTKLLGELAKMIQKQSEKIEKLEEIVMKQQAMIAN